MRTQGDVYVAAGQGGKKRLSGRVAYVSRQVGQADAQRLQKPCGVVGVLPRKKFGGGKQRSLAAARHRVQGCHESHQSLARTYVAL